MVVPHVSSILHLFFTHGLIVRENTNPATLDICRGLMKCQVEITKGTNWRLLTKLLYQFEYLPNCVPGDFIHQHFTPSLVNLAVAGVSYQHLGFLFHFSSLDFIVEGKTSQVASNAYTLYVFKIQHQRSTKEVAQRDFSYESLLCKFLLHQAYLHSPVCTCYRDF